MPDNLDALDQISRIDARLQFVAESLSPAKDYTRQAIGGLGAVLHDCMNDLESLYDIIEGAQDDAPENPRA